MFIPSRCLLNFVKRLFNYTQILDVVLFWIQNDTEENTTMLLRWTIFKTPLKENENNSGVLFGELSFKCFGCISFVVF